MKKIILFAAVALAGVACQKHPYPVDRDGKFMVYTVKGEEVPETALKYFVPEEVNVIEGKGEAKLSDSQNALKLVSQVKLNMEKLGYTPAATKEEADLGLQLTYMEETTQYLQYVSDPYWWLDYGYGYWNPGYWGNWHHYAYYYPVTYSTATTTFVVDMVDLKTEQGEDKPLPVMWSAFIGGQTGSYINVDVIKLRDGIDQAFAQSQYLKRN